MSKAKVINPAGEEQTERTLKKEVWGIKPNNQVVQEAINLTGASLRQGTAATKTRNEVRGGGRKPWRQKGTGRARQGSIRSPQWTGGGVVFGPKPRSYKKKMNAKKRELALKSALSIKASNKEVIVLKDFTVASPKTKELEKMLQKMGVNNRILLVVNELTDNLILATRNLHYVDLISVDDLNVYDIIDAPQIYITEEALAVVEEVLSYDG